MISNLVLSILFALITIAGIANSIAASRYAREAKAAAERSATAARQAEATPARSRAVQDLATKLDEQQAEPTRLTYEQLLPLAAAIRRRETTGHGILQPPWPGCPTCGQTPTDLLVRNDGPGQFIENRVAFGFRPCGHNFTADAYDLYRATEQP